MMLGRELTSWQTPLRALTEMQREMNHLFSRFFGDGEQVGTQWLSASESFVPRVESAVRENALYVKADLSGIDPKDVELTVEGTQLTLERARKGVNQTPRIFTNGGRESAVTHSHHTPIRAEKISYAHPAEPGVLSPHPVRTDEVDGERRGPDSGRVGLQ